MSKKSNGFVALACIVILIIRREMLLIVKQFAHPTDYFCSVEVS